MAKLLVFLDLTPMDSSLMENVKRITNEMSIEKIGFCHYVEIQEVTDNVNSYFKDLDAPLDEILRDEITETAEQFGFLPDNFEVLIHIRGGKDSLTDWVNNSEYDLCIFGKKVIHVGTGVFSGRLCRLVEKPILFVTESTLISMDRVLVPTEFSHYSKKVVNLINGLKDFKPKDITALHVYHVPPAYFPFISEQSDDLIEKAKAHARKKMDHFVEKSFPNRHVQRELIYAGENTTAKVIFDYAVTHHMDLVIMGVKGKTDDDNILIGSVSENLIKRDKNIPVLLVK